MSLFPAYSSEAPPKKDLVEDNKDWLCNSSYDHSNFQDAKLQKKETSESLEKSPEKVCAKKRKKEKKSKKKSADRNSNPPKVLHVVDESISIRSHLNKQTFIEETGLSFERAFRIDLKSDPENIFYEHLEQKYIAKYKSFLQQPFGLTSKEKVLWPKKTPQKLKDNSFRYFSKKALRLLNKTGIGEKLNVDNNSQSLLGNLSFIPIESHSSFRIRDFSQTCFEGVSTSWKSQSRLNVGTNDSGITEISSIELQLRNRTESFNKRLLDSPQNIQLWLDFVDFQDEVCRSGDMSKTHTDATIVEKKIAILDRALERNPKSIQLNIEKINLCRNVWSNDKLIQFWDNLIFLNPNDTDVWQEYIIFVLSNLTYFTTNHIVKLYSKCLRTLSDLSEGIIKSHKAPHNIVCIMIEIFSQLCFVLKSVGYTERAVASFQALIELNIFDCPTVHSLSSTEQIACFEPFWDSGVARFGENGAIGWAATLEEKKTHISELVTQSDLSTMEDDILSKKLPQSNTWLEFEKLRESHHWLPWRPNPEYDQTDEDIDDPERTVPFDDISIFLFRISQEADKFMLIVHFLVFLGFSPHDFGCSVSCGSDRRTYLTVNNFDVLSRTINRLFTSHLPSPLYLNNDMKSQKKMEFINNVFTQALVKFSLKYKILLSHLWIKSSLIHRDAKNEDLKNIKKLAKQLLKESGNRNCLLLWCDYIKCEVLTRSNPKKTFETLLSSSTSAIADENFSTTELWYFVCTFISVCLGFHEHCKVDSQLLSHSEIIWLLVAIGSKEKYIPYENEMIKPTQILKAVSGFKSFLGRSLSSISSLTSNLCNCLDPCAYSTLDCSKCYAYLQYFTKGISSAMEVFKDLAESVESKLTESYKSYMMEQISIAETEFMNFHTWNSTASLKSLQLHLFESVERYPNSPSLLYFLIKLRTASAVISPMRRFFGKILKKHSKLQPVTWIFALASEVSISHSIAEQHELNINSSISEVPTNNGIKWKIRSLYETALQTHSCSCIPILWRSFMKFEMLNNEHERARSVFLRAMQNCGWSKELLIDGIQYFEDELKQILDFMKEKQIRIHTPLEEVILLMDHTGIS